MSGVLSSAFNFIFGGVCVLSIVLLANVKLNVNIPKQTVFLRKDNTVILDGRFVIDEKVIANLEAQSQKMDSILPSDEIIYLVLTTYHGLFPYGTRLVDVLQVLRHDVSIVYPLEVHKGIQIVDEFLTDMRLLEDTLSQEVRVKKLEKNADRKSMGGKEEVLGDIVQAVCDSSLYGTKVKTVSYKDWFLEVEIAHCPILNYPMSVRWSYAF